MRLVYTETGAEVNIGDVIKVGQGTGYVKDARVDYFREPHKPDSSGKVTIMMPNGATHEYYVSVIGAEWIEREDRDERPMMRNGKPLKSLPDGAPRRMADGKNAWRKMTDEQRAEFLEWIANAPDAPDTDVAKRIVPRHHAGLGALLLGDK